MKKSQLLELIKNVVREEQDYQQLFKHMLDKVGKSITDMSDEQKKKFFNAVDTAYKAKSEGRLRGYNEAELTAGQKKIDTDGDGEIEGSDLAALRAGKKVNEDVNFRDGKYRFYSKQGVGYLTYDGREISSGDFDWEDGSNSYWLYHSSWGGQKAFDSGKDVIAYFKKNKITTESTNEGVKKKK